MGRSAQGFFWIWDFFRKRGLDFSSEPTEIRLTVIKGETGERTGSGHGGQYDPTSGVTCELNDESSTLKEKASTSEEETGTPKSVRISLSDGTMRGSVSAIKKKLEEQSIVLSQSGDILSIGLLGEPAPQFLVVNEYDVELADLMDDEESDEDEALISWMSSLAPKGPFAGMFPAATVKGRRGRCLVVYVLNRNEADQMPVYRRWPLVHYHLLAGVEMPHGVRDFREDQDGFKACVKRNVRIARRRSI
jgi:hypothetical protein